MTYHNELMKRANMQAGGIIEFYNSSWHNDACGSILCDIDASAETYVQLFAFESEEEMRAEGFEDLFQVVCYECGDFNESMVLFTNDEKLAIDYAVQQAKIMQDEQDVKDYEAECAKGFEHDGIWISDKMKSPCGRFDLTEEESIKLYGNR